MGNDQPKKRPQPKQDPSDKMFDTMFEFKMMGKQMAKEAKKAETQNKNLIKKVKDCIAKGDYEQAKVAASDAIRQKNQVRRYRVLSSKIDTVAQRLQSAYQNQRLTEQMQSLTQQMVGAGNMMDMVKMTETMANFEKLFDDLDVNSAMMDQVFDNVNAGTVNDAEVNTLIQQVAQQNGMKLSDDFDQVQIGEGGMAEPAQQEQVGAGGFPMA
jgi:charged multivesicular body protein 1